MKKFIITEEEKNRILGMHEDHGYNSLNEQTGNWQDDVIKYFPVTGKKITFSLETINGEEVVILS